MRHLIPCLALLVAAVLLYGAAAENKCDPSSTNCAGAVKEQGARASAFTKPGQKVVASTQAAPAAAAHPKAAKGPAKKVGAKAAAKASKKPGPQPLASKVAQDGTYYDPEEAEPQQDYDSSKWQQEDGLQDAPITGVLQFSVAFSEDLPNYFDCDEGYVPDGFGNSVGDPSCEIVSDGVEFAYEGHSNRFTVDLDPTGLITLTDIVKKAGKNNPMVIVLTSPAFRGYTIAPVSVSDFGTVSADLSDDTLTITVPELTDLAAGQKLEATWKLSVCDSTGDGNDCCINGQYKRPHAVCREVTGPCDVEEYCTGHDATCPTDEFVPQGKICKHPETFCEAPFECDGQHGDCMPLYKDEFTPCPWAKDCDGCTFNTSGTDLKYSRTGSNPYSKGYKAGEYGKPETHWPVCIGKCTTTGSCLMQPTAATCCREDEEAYPLEEEDEYEQYPGPKDKYDSKEKYDSKKEGYGSGKYHPAQLEAGPRHPRDPRVGTAEVLVEVRQSTSASRREARRKRLERRRAAARTPKIDDETPDSHDATSSDEPTTHGKHADKQHGSKTTDPSKTTKPKVDTEHDYFGGKHEDTHPHSRGDEPDHDGPDGSPRGGDGYGKDSDSYSKDSYGKQSYDKSSYGKEGYGKEGYGKEGYGKGYSEGKEDGYDSYSSEEEEMPLSCWSG